MRGLLGLPAILYRVGLGPLLGHRFLLLVTTGRRTGRRREVVLEVMRYDGAAREAVVMAGWGAESGWLRNLEAGLGREVRIGRERYVPRHRVLGPDEAVGVLSAYERQNRLTGPLMRRVLSGLVGWRYDGSPAARRRVVEQLPFVGFRPADAD